MEGVPKYPVKEIKKYKKLHLWWDMTLGEAMYRMAIINSYRTIAVDETKKLTYSELNSLANRLAMGFLELGFRTGDTVIMQMPNVVEFLVIFFALQRIGVVPIMGVPRHGLTELTYFGNSSKAIAWIGPSFYRKTDYLQMMPELKGKVPSLKHIITVDEGHEKPGAISYSHLLAKKGRYTEKSLEKYFPDPDEPCVLIPTGGTTGLPKLVPLSHNVYLCKAYFSVTQSYRNPYDVNLVVTPLAHDAALIRLLSRLIVDGKLVLGNSTRATDIMELIQRERVTRMFLVPALVIDFLNEPDRGKYDLSSLKNLTSGGAYIAPETIREARNKLGITVYSSLGMAEGVYIGPRPDYPVEEIIQTIGKPFCPWNTVKLLDNEDRDVPQGKEGEIAGKGPTVFSGYYKAEEANKRAFNREGLYRTGDLARINSQGNFILTGRKKDLINRGGEKVNAEQVEEMLLAMEGVADAAVVAMPDHRLGEKVCAYIKAKEGYSFNLDKVTSYMKSKGASVILLPERIEMIDEMPFTAIGKVNKKILRQRIADKLAQENK